QGTPASIRIRVTEWDAASNAYVTPNWDDPLVVETVEFTPAADSPAGPELDPRFDGGLVAVEESQAGLRDAVFSLLGEQSLLTGGPGSRRLNLVVGDVELAHKGGAGDAGADQELVDQVLQASSNQLSDFSDGDYTTTPVSTTTAEGGALTAYYAYSRSVVVDGDEFTASTQIVVAIDSYTRTASGDANPALGLSGHYTFVFSADGTIQADGTLDVASYSLTETIEFDYLHSTTTSVPGSNRTTTRTTAGDYSLIRQEGAGNSGTFSQTYVSQPFTQTETIRLETWFVDSGTESGNVGGRHTTRTFDTTEHSIYERTTTVSGGLIAADAGGQSAGGSITIDVAVQFDRDHSETTSYHATYAHGNSESGSDSFSETDFSEARLFVATTDYADGVSSTQRYTLNVNRHGSVRVHGSGSATSHSPGSNYSESWNYSGNSSGGSSLSVQGTYAEQFAGGKKTTRLDASGASSGSFAASGTAGGSATSSTSGQGYASSGSGSSSLSFQMSVSANGSATLRRVDDTFTLTGRESLAVSASARTRSSSNGSYSSLVDGVSTQVSSSSRQGASAQRGSQSSTSYRTTDRAQKTTGTLSSSLTVEASSASQGVGTTSDGESTTITRSNETGSTSLATRLSARFSSEQSSAGGRDDASSGSGSRTQRSTGHATSYVGTDDGFSLTVTTGDRSESESFNFVDDNGDVVRRGSFSRNESGAVNTVSQITAVLDGGKTSVSARNDARASSSKDLVGTFTEKDGGSRVLAATSERRTANAASESRYATADSGDGSRSRSTGKQTTTSLTTEGSGGIVGLTDGEITLNTGTMSRVALGRGSSSGTSFEERTTAVAETPHSPATTTRTTSNSRGSTQATSLTSVSGIYSGVGRPTIAASVTLLETGSTSGSGEATVEARVRSEGATSTSDRTDRVTSSGSSRGSFTSTAGGMVRDGLFGASSHTMVNMQSSGSSDGRTKSSYAESLQSAVGSTSSSGSATRSDGSSSSQRFNGLVSTDSRGPASRSGVAATSESGGDSPSEQELTSRNGTTSSTGSGSTKTEHSSRGNSNSGGFASFWVGTGSSGGKLDVSATGALTADHEKVRQAGQSQAKNSGHEKNDYTTGSSHVTIAPGLLAWTWTTTTWDGGGNASSDTTNDFEHEEDLTGEDDPAAGAEEAEEEASFGTFRSTGREKVTTVTGEAAAFANESETGGSLRRSVDAQELKTSASESAVRSTTITTLDATFARNATLANGDAVRRNLQTEEKTTRTFTTAGSDPGDLQKLKIDRTFDEKDETVTTYATPGISTVAQQLLPVTNRTETNVVKEQTTYSSSHRLGADGQSAVGGRLNASHNRTATHKVDETGRVDDQNRTAVTKTNQSGTTTTLVQTERLSYADGPAGRELRGDATTVKTVVRREKVEFTGEDDGFSTFRTINNTTLHVDNSHTETTDSKQTFGEKTVSSSTTSRHGSESEVWHRDNVEEFSSGVRNRQERTERTTRTYDSPGSGSGGSDHRTHEDFGTSSGMPTRFDDYVPPPGYQGSNPQPPTPFYENGGWDTVEVDKNLEAPYYAGSWNARAHYDANDPPAASAPRKSEGGPVPNPGTIDAMTDAQFRAFVDSLPDDLAGFTAALAGLSKTDQAAFRARVMADVQGGSVQQDSLLGAGAWGLGQGVANVANGGTDLAFETVNLPMHALNLGFWLGGKLGGAEGLKVPTIHWDWSKNLVIAENQVDHDVSKLFGAVGVGAAAARYLPKAVEAVKRGFQKPVRTPVAEVPKAAPAPRAPRPGSIGGNPANRVIEVPTKNGKLVNRHVRITAEDAQRYRNAVADRYNQLLKETPEGLSQEAKSAWRHQKVNEFRRQWLDEFYRTRDY
ncbi:MAG: hypothetical protein KF847_08105, partial [Pirellulales bacterium]|nr:hypothetical protein [Pirellulales bacterium]